MTTHGNYEAAHFCNESLQSVKSPESLPQPEGVSLAGQFSSVTPATEVLINSTLPEPQGTEISPSANFQPPLTERNILP